MIQKLENGETLITLGEGTVLAGKVYGLDNEKPFGIDFTNEKGKSEDAVIINLSGQRGVASYIMALIRFLDSDTEDFQKVGEELKKHLEPLLPIEKER
ncbi:hypothetical protein [Virgibacillus halodenitrificans]|uniref:hypothetical protein n=1 Tax=Virgibacillus halodenitrificans TaxID=1482 RepID=UPI000EF51EAA|nr:hypothetical protein [Virgibacillus halodenitrificans]